MHGDEGKQLSLCVDLRQEVTGRICPQLRSLTRSRTACLIGGWGGPTGRSA